MEGGAPGGDQPPGAPGQEEEPDYENMSLEELQGELGKLQGEGGEQGQPPGEAPPPAQKPPMKKSFFRELDL
jgi:hypothetical protein